MSVIEMRKLAQTDALTGLANRRSFDEKLARAVGEGKSFSMIIADIDHFKKINDEYGHTFGDHVLKAVARAIASALRSDSYVARTGGEEFTIMTPKTDSRGASAVAERIRLAVENLPLRIETKPVKVTISLGIALSTPGANGEQIYQAADKALYSSKASGRNCSTLCDQNAISSGTERYKIYKS